MLLNVTRKRRSAFVLLSVAACGTGILQASAGQRHPACGPLASPPAGWVCIPQFGRDSWIGAYFDSLSGVLVRFHTGDDRLRFWARYPASSGVDQASSGSVKGIRYEAATILQPRARMEAYWKQVHDVDPAEAPDLPPADAGAVVVVFYRANRNPMNFEAAVCDDHQRERVLDLLTKGPGLDLTRQGGRTKEDSRPSHEQLALPFKGKTISDAVAVLGAPTLVRPRGCDGVGLTYVDNAAGRGLSMDFARDGQFVSQKATVPN